MLQIAHEARLIDGADRTDAHRAGGNLPEGPHQPRVRIRTQPLAPDLLPEVRKLLLAQAALEKGSCIHARHRVRLEIDQVCATSLAPGAEKMIEPSLDAFGRSWVPADRTA